MPHVRNFSESMFDAVTVGLRCIEKKVYDELGCTGRTDYKVWFGQFVKQGEKDWMSIFRTQQEAEN